MDLKIKNKVAVVTGASAGIGEAVARELAAGGAKLVITAFTASRLSAVANSLRQVYDAEVVDIAMDITEADAANRLVRAALENFGGLDIVVNNAGRAHPGGLLENTVDDWRDMEELKLHAMVRLNQEAIPVMREHGWGRIINMSSIGGIFPNPKLLVSHSISAAINTLTRGMALEVAKDGILVNAIGIGAIRTQNWEHNMIPKVRETRPDLAALSDEELLAHVGKDYTPVGRLGTPEEVAAITVFLCSERNGFITGSTIEASGGADRFF